MLDFFLLKEGRRMVVTPLNRSRMGVDRSCNQLIKHVLVRCVV